MITTWSAALSFLYYSNLLLKNGKTYEMRIFLLVWVSFLLFCLTFLLKTNMGYFICFYVSPDWFLLLFNATLIGTYDRLRKSSLIYEAWTTISKSIKVHIDSSNIVEVKKADYLVVYTLQKGWKSIGFSMKSPWRILPILFSFHDVHQHEESHQDTWINCKIFHGFFSEIKVKLLAERSTAV